MDFTVDGWEVVEKLYLAAATPAINCSAQASLKVKIAVERVFPEWPFIKL